MVFLSYCWCMHHCWPFLVTFCFLQIIITQNHFFYDGWSHPRDWQFSNSSSLSWCMGISNIQKPLISAVNTNIILCPQYHWKWLARGRYLDIPCRSSCISNIQLFLEPYRTTWIENSVDERMIAKPGIMKIQSKS